MEGVGARLGRSSTRYGGPTTVFSGPVRRWKKKWVSSAAVANRFSQTSNGNNNGSHLLLYKWTPIAQFTSNNGDKDDNLVASTALEESPPPRRRFRYVPIAVQEVPKKESSEKIDDEAKPSGTDQSAGTTSKSEGSVGKQDINDLPMEESLASEQDESARQDLSETNLDLSLGFKAHDEDHDSNSKTVDRSKDGQLERARSGGVGT